MIAFAAALLTAAPPAAADPVTGRWITEDGSALVAIAPCGGKLCGRIERVLVSKPGQPTTDVANPDPRLRSRPFVGLPILTGFTDGGAVWKGQIYDPRAGKTYRSELRREGDTLHVKGCIAIFCRNQRWRRAR